MSNSVGDTYSPKYLVMVNAGSNNYKFYKMEPQNDTLHVTYGRINGGDNGFYGAHEVDYPLDMFWKKYQEKINKGYEDKTDIYLVTPQPEQGDEDTDTTSTVGKRLYTKLLAYSKKLISDSCLSTEICPAMVEESERLLNQLYKATSVSKFNDILLELLAVSPRKVDKVAHLMATDKKDFAEIIQREEDLCDAMKVVCKVPTVKKSKKQLAGDFDGAEILEATEAQKEEVLKHLSAQLKPKVKNVYRVIDKAKKERFDKYIEKNNIKTVKELWHGSRNENWLSIVNTGLLLKPNAVITGKMFGDGIYFAPSSMKSWGYTSVYGARWTNGRSNTGFMGLYATAFGTPKDVTGPEDWTQKRLDKEGKNCVYAHKGNYLYNDEIVFYSEEATVLNYLVEFSDK